MPIWRFLITPRPGASDAVGRQLRENLIDFGVHSAETIQSGRIFLIELEGHRDRKLADRIARDLLVDPVSEDVAIRSERDPLPDPKTSLAVEVHLKPGVMDNVAQSTLLALSEMGIRARSVRTARRFDIHPAPNDSDISRISRLIGNACIEDIFIGTPPIKPPPTPPAYSFRLRTVPLRDLDDAGLARLSRDTHLFLSLEEMQAIRNQFRKADRNPTDLELETLAQTWSEHCVHKTLKSPYLYRGAPFPNRDRPGDNDAGEFRVEYANLLRDTIARATHELIAEGRGPTCLSVFKDNAGVIAFDEEHGIAFKVETHNHPSAIEPYGGASTGVGGVIRDVLGCGLGAKPIANTDVFCVAPPDWPVDAVPKGVIHPRSTLRGVVAGVRDYGNRMGIPTVNGAVHFDPRYLGNPLVYCGCAGLISRDRIDKAARPGDAVVLIGGRTGRDGIHGATFSSAELTDTHEDEFAH
ncbi:MAG TPA: phosphoribosylformylglycinamidine synthase subunit PurS, partial [Phycisphaerae bacterium]|nr:phosphoribosylformylglycinamidine synthase subunit PurS [Phycisphaerae bacterium]